MELLQNFVDRIALNDAPGSCRDELSAGSRQRHRDKNPVLVEIMAFGLS
ncbi:hypothetical protein VSR69_37655 [Paraburkholderia phytofirmans]